MKNFNGYIKVTNIPSFIEQIELKLSHKETLREITKLEFEEYCLKKHGKPLFGNYRSLADCESGSSERSRRVRDLSEPNEPCKKICRSNFDAKYWNYIETIIPLDRDIESLVKLLAVAVNADLNKNELYVSFSNYYIVIED